MRHPVPTRLSLAMFLSALACGAIAVSAATAAPSPTAGCAWTRHSKQVSKRVRRHGQWRRVKRLKRWWACEATPGASISQPPLPIPPTPETPAGEEPAPQVGHLGVKAVEYSYTLSRPDVAAGEVIVELNNQGEDPHNLKLEREGSEEEALEVPTAAAAAQTSARFTLSPGTYHLYCSLYKHDAKGMNATLVVTGE